MSFSSDPTEIPSTPTPSYRRPLQPRTPSPEDSERTPTPERYILDPGSPNYAPSDDDKTVIVGSSPPLPALEDIRGKELSEAIVKDEEDTEDESDMILTGGNGEPLGHRRRTGFAGRGNNLLLTLKKQKEAAEQKFGPYGPPQTFASAGTELSVRTSAPIPPAPAIDVVLAVSPNPAAARESILVDAMCKRFCDDFPHFGHVSLYQHLRYWSNLERDRDVAWRELKPLSASTIRQRAVKGRDLHWANTVPVVKRLVDRAVSDGERSLIISGLGGGDDVRGPVEGFESTVAKARAIVVFSDGQAGLEKPYAARDLNVVLGQDVEGTYKALQAGMVEKMVARVKIGGDSAAAAAAAAAAAGLQGEGDEMVEGV